VKKECAEKNTEIDVVMLFGKIHIQIKIVTQCISEESSVIVVGKCDRECIGVDLIDVIWRRFCDENSTSCSKWTCFQR
jgi:hypothetical protein